MTNKVSLVDERGIPKGARKREGGYGDPLCTSGGKHQFWLVTYEGRTCRWLEVISADGHSTWEPA